MSLSKMNRNLATQIQSVREFAAELRTAEPSVESDVKGGGGDHDSEVTSDAKTEPEREPSKNAHAARVLFDADQYLERLTLLKARTTSRDDGWTVPLKELERAIALGAVRHVGSAPTDDALKALLESFPHCAQVIEHVRRRCVLARLVPNAPLRLPPMLLSGEPGVGKTAFCQRLAAAMAVPLFNIDVGTLDASFKLTGLDAGYATGKPGLVWDALQQACMSPILVLDESDKLANLNGEGLGFLLGLMEPTSAVRYVDACMGVPLDASCIHWLATCNEPARIDAALRSRMQEFTITVPTRTQMPAVIRSVYKGLRESESWGLLFEADLTPDVIEALASMPPRAIWQSLSEACANAAVNGRRHLEVQDLPKERLHGKVRKMGFV